MVTEVKKITMEVIVFRGFEKYLVDETFVLPTDYVVASDGSVQIATNFPQFQQRFQQVDPIEGLFKFGVTLAFGYVALTAVSDVLNAIFSPYNDKPLNNRDRCYIRERDYEICYYCGIWAPNGHGDHMQSRRDSGPNAYWNLTWACVLCNLSKGSLNSEEFLALC